MALLEPYLHTYIGSRPTRTSSDEQKNEELLCESSEDLLQAFEETFQHNGLSMLAPLVSNPLRKRWISQPPFLVSNDYKTKLLSYLWLQKAFEIPGPTNIVFNLVEYPYFALAFKKSSRFTVDSTTLMSGLPVVTIGIQDVAGGSACAFLCNYRLDNFDTKNSLQLVESERLHSLESDDQCQMIRVKNFSPIAPVARQAFAAMVEREAGENESFLLDIYSALLSQNRANRLLHDLIDDDREMIRIQKMLSLVQTCFYPINDDRETVYLFSSNILKSDDATGEDIYSRPRNERGGGCLKMVGEIKVYDYSSYHALADLIISKQSESHQVFDKYRLADAKQQVQRHALKAGISAIMGRNMSHNLGSHALGYIAEAVECDPTNGSSECYAPGDLARFLRYTQKRMDFIAQISTAPPSWCLTLPLTYNQHIDVRSSVLGNYCQSACLLDNIVRSDKLRFVPAHRGEDEHLVQFKVESNGVECSSVEYESGECLEGKPSAGGKGVTLLEADVPHAQIGAHALYSILENLIRNAAKYRDVRNEDLTLRVEIHESWPHHWDMGDATFTHAQKRRKTHEQWQDEMLQVVVSHQGKTERQAAEQLNKYLSQDIINPVTGELDGGQWGMKEMKICAAYLRLTRQEETDSLFHAYRDGKGKAPPMIEVLWGHPHRGGIVPLMGAPVGAPAPQSREVQEVESEPGSLELRSLHTVFYLMKPRDVLVVNDEWAEKFDGDTELRATFLRKGVEFWQVQSDPRSLRRRLENGYRLRHQLMVVWVQDARTFSWDWLIEHLNSLPCRLILCGVAPGDVADEAQRHRLQRAVEFVTPEELTASLGDAQPNQDPQQWRLALWDLWVQKRYAKRHDQGLPLYIRWEKGWHDDPKSTPLDGIARFVSQSIGENGEVRCWGDALAGRRPQDIGSVAGALVFDHQSRVNLPSQAGHWLYEGSRFHEGVDSGTPVRNLAERIVAEEREGGIGFASRLMLRQVQEAGVVTVGLLDERLFERRKDDGTKASGAAKYEAMSLQEVWRKRGVYFLDHERILGEDGTGELLKGGNRPFRALNVTGSDGIGRASDDLLQADGRGNHAYDFLIVHEGLLEKWRSARPEGERQGEPTRWPQLWQELQTRCRYLIITTGRGRPKTAQEHHLRWVEFSNLSDRVLRGTKLELVRLLLAVKAESIGKFES